MSRRKIMRRRRRITVSVLFVLIMTVVISCVAANKAEDEFIKVVVSNGDSVWTIARENNPEDIDVRKLVTKIIRANNIKNGMIFAGQELIIPIN